MPPPKITSAKLYGTGPAGHQPQLLLEVDGLSPKEPVGHQWSLPTAAFRDRREREGVEPCGEPTCTGIACACLQCRCCKQTLRILLNEVWTAHHGPDNLPHTDIDAKRLAKIGAIPGRAWCEEHQAIEAADAHAAGPIAMIVPNL